ncbi:MAG: tetratricopeptide repeat protein [Candidatus Babeliales bacterium]
MQQKVTNKVFYIIQSSYQEIKNFKYVKELLIGIGLLVGMIVGFLLYRVYAVYQEQKSQEILGQYIGEYNQIKDGDPADWQRIASLFQQGSEQYSNSHLTPYFTLFQADALLKENKNQEALSLLDRAIKQASNSPLLSLIKTKHALILLDESDEVMQKNGIEELKKLAEDKKNQFRDTAQFYLGQYYWVTNSIKQAQDSWQELIDEQYKEKLGPSPWVDLAKKRLTYIVE